MNPWWKRPSSESSSSASRSRSDEAPRSNDRDDRKSRNDGNDQDEPRGRRRRRSRRRGGGGNDGGNGGGNGGSRQGGQRSQERKAPADGNRSGGRRGGRRRGRGGSNRQATKPGTGRTAVLVDVEALHRHCKADGEGPESARNLFDGVKGEVRRYAVSCGLRKQKVQRILADHDFEIERIEGGVEDARLRIALDALELALAHPGIRILLHAHETGLEILVERLRHHGAQVEFFSLLDPPVVDAGGSAAGSAAEKEEDDDEDDDEDDAGNDAGNDDESEPQDDDDDDDSVDTDFEDDDEDEDAPRRSRRGGRRGGGRRDDEIDHHGRKPRRHGREERRHGREQDASTSDPFELLTRAIGRISASGGEVVWATRVRQELTALDPLFNELDHGYHSFDDLLREAERRGRVALQKDPRTSTFIIVGYRAA